MLPNLLRHLSDESETQNFRQLRKQEHFLFATKRLDDNPDEQMKRKAIALLNSQKLGKLVRDNRRNQLSQEKSVYII